MRTFINSLYIKVFDIEDEIMYEHGDQGTKVRLVKASASAASTPKRATFSSTPHSDGPDALEHNSPRHAGQLRTHTVSQRLSGVTEAVFHGASPLAQVYAPLQVDDEDDNMAENGHGVNSHSAHTPPATGVSVSYGPVTKRRHPSMVHRRLSNDHTSPFLTGEGLGIGTQMSVSGSSTHPTEEHTPEEYNPMSVTQVEREEEELSGDLGLRLAGMEERQKRIEDMLIQLINR